MIVVIIGPTGVGKTKLSLELAKKYNAEIINADAMQVYKEMNIGTAKVTDKMGITHHLLSIRSVNEPYSVYEYQKDGRKLIERLKKENKNNLAWSKYEKDDYQKLQISIKEMYINEPTFPLDWENEAWIKVAKSKK